LVTGTCSSVPKVSPGSFVPLPHENRSVGGWVGGGGGQREVSSGQRATVRETSGFDQRQRCTSALVYTNARSRVAPDELGMHATMLHPTSYACTQP
jgi:hypothetical protein